MLVLTDTDIKTHLDITGKLPHTNDVDEFSLCEKYVAINRTAERFYHNMACRFFDTFCSDEEREKEFLNNAD